MDYKTEGQVYKQDNMQIINDDCMNIMKQTPDNYYDLAICDPPYGIGIDGQKESIKGKKSDRKYHEPKGWDSAPPSVEYFNELHRVSKNCVIWGGNYFLYGLNEGHKGWLIWDKGQHGLTMSDCEMAYTTFDSPTRIWTKNRCVLKQEGTTIHPTQKPVKLYNWIYANYAEEGQKILDTHGGSFSNAIAAHYAKMHFVGCELDEDYYKASIERIRKETRQLELF